MYDSITPALYISQDVISDCSSVILESLTERLMQFVVNVTLRCVHWESELMKGALTLTSLRYQIGEVGELIHVLYEIVSLARTVSPCAVIDVISDIELRYSHNGEIRNACKGLKEAAFEPLGRLVVDFVLSGDLSMDKYGECFVGPDFSVREVAITPSCLADVKELIARTARSSHRLSTLGVTSRDHMSPAMQEMAENPIKLLNSNYAITSLRATSLVVEKLLMDTVNAKSALEVELALLNDYFFMQISLMDELSAELEKPVKLINRVKVDDIVKSSTKGLFSSVLHAFPLEDFRTHTPGHDDDTTIGLRAFTLQRQVATGVSLVVTDSALMKLQSIFRHLFFGKSVEVKLSKLWTDFQALRMIDFQNRLLPCHALLHQMTHFVSNYLFFVSVDVIAAKRWEAVPTASSVSDARDTLDALLEAVLAETNLDSFIYKSVNKVMSTCALFSAHMSRFVCMHADAESLLAATEQPKFTGMIDKFQDAFQGQTNSLIVQLKSQVKVNKSAHSLIARLDFNSFFSDKMGI